MGKDKQLEHLMSQIGDFGLYQKRQYCLHVLGGFLCFIMSKILLTEIYNLCKFILAGLHMLSLSTVAPTPNHRCFIPDVDLYLNISSDFLHNYIPTSEDGTLDSCHRYNGSDTNAIIDCDGQYFYDKQYYIDSKVIDWDMVCDRRWMRAMMQSIYMLGVLFAALICGPLADKFGRKPIFCIAAVLQLASGLCCAFVMNLTLYVICLFLYGAFGSGAAYITAFTLSMELIGSSKRTMCGIGFSVVFGFGVMLVAMYASFISSPSILQLVYALHALTIIGHYWLIDESVRWLWSQGRKTDALLVLEKAAKLNGVKLDLEVPPDETENDFEEAQDAGVIPLLKTPIIRRRTLNVTFNWFANSLVFYGLSLNSGNLAGNPFLVLFLVGLAEIPGYLLAIFLIDRLGRRLVCTMFMVFGGLACIIAAFILHETVVTAIVLIGKMFISGSFAIIYNYTAELFPTTCRNSAIGLGTTAARLSGALTPLITLLDTLDKRLPTILFGCVSIASALITLFLPETLNAEMFQTIEEVENFKNSFDDTGYATCYNCISRKRRVLAD